MSAATVRSSPLRVWTARSRASRRLAWAELRAASSACCEASRSGRYSAELSGSSRAAGGLGFEPCDLDLAQLQPAEGLAALAAGEVAVERDKDRPGLDPLPLADMDRGDPATARVVHHLDPASRLDGARRLDHFVDLRPGEPAEERHEQGGEAGDQRARQCRVASLDRVACELGFALQVAASATATAQPAACSPADAVRALVMARISAGLPDWTKRPRSSEKHAVAGLEHRRTVR